MVLCRSAVKQLCRRQGLARHVHVAPATAGRHVERLAPAPVAHRESTAGGNAFAGRRRRCRELGRGVPRGPPRARPRRRRCSRRRPSTATSATGRCRSRPTASCGARTTRGRWSASCGDPADAPREPVGRARGEPVPRRSRPQVVSGLDGVDRGLDPGAPTTRPYADEAPRLPASLMEALDALDADPVFAAALGPDVVSWIATLKRAEVTRYLRRSPTGSSASTTTSCSGWLRRRRRRGGDRGCVAARLADRQLSSQARPGLRPAPTLLTALVRSPGPVGSPRRPRPRLGADSGSSPLPLTRPTLAPGPPLPRPPPPPPPPPSDRVVVAGGAYCSPAVLLRSGIGPAGDLRALGSTSPTRRSCPSCRARPPTCPRP